MSDRWQALLDIARHTPSPHNTQPWKIKIIDSERATLFLDKARMLPDEDTTGCFLICAMSMFLEACSIIAVNLGCSFEYELIENSEDDSLIVFANMRLIEGDSNVSASKYSNDLFLLRRTSRLEHTDNDPIPEAALGGVASLAEEYGMQFSRISATRKIEDILSTNIEAIFQDFNDAKYHDEIVKWFRYTKKEGSAKRDGLEARCMNTSPLEFWIMAKFPQMLQVPFVSKILFNYYRKNLGKTKNIGIFSGEFFNRQGAINTGAFLLRVWLELTIHNIFILPFGNLVTNTHAAQWMAEFTKIDHIWLVFRFGRTELAPKSHRLKVEEILIHD